MSILDNLAASLRDAYTTISDKALQFKNQSFADAAMASCALVSMADGVLQPEERSKVVACIQNITDLHAFKATDLRDLFDGFCKQATDQFGRVEVIKAVRKVRVDHDQADMVVKIGIIIAKSKGGALEECEKDAIREIIRELGLDVTNYDLSAPSAAAAPPPSPAPAVTPRPAPAPTASAPPFVSNPKPAAAAAMPRVIGAAAKVAKIGERISLKAIDGTAPTRLLLGFGWEDPTQDKATVTANVYDKDKSLLGRANLVAASTVGGVVHNGNVRTTNAFGDDETIAIDFSQLPASATSVLFTISNGGSVRSINSAYVRFIDSGNNAQLVRFDFTSTGEQAVIMVGRIYLNNGEWKFAAIGDALSTANAGSLSTFA